MKDGADARTQLELALVKAADPARDASQKALLARLERLERGGAAAPSPAARSARTQPADRRRPRCSPSRRPSPPSPPIETPTDGPAIVAAVEVETPAPPEARARRRGRRRARRRRRRTLRELWPAVLEQLEGSLKAMLGETVPLGVEDDRLTVAFSESAMLMFRHADKPANREAVAAAVRAVTGRALRRPLRAALGRRARARGADEPLSCPSTSSSTA